ncbi:MAG: hypothetical protein KY475_02840 [Planctomycetes bacterium]|nr:hypothetical protein [Planctomycetota bacterium]
MRQFIQRFDMAESDEVLGHPPRPDFSADWRQPQERTKVAFFYRGPGEGTDAAIAALSRSRPVFRAAVNECLRAGSLESPIGNGLISMFILQYAATRLLHSWGVVEDERFGHWMGEAVAACVGGDMSVGEAMECLSALPPEAGEADETSNENVDAWAAQGGRLIVEIGPPPRTPQGRFPDVKPGAPVRLPLFGDPATEKSRHWRCVAALYAHGVKIDWPAFYGNAPTTRSGPLLRSI